MKLLIILAAATAPLQGSSGAKAQISGLIVRDAYLPYQVIQRQANPMHSLFLKISLWFWLSVILISLTMVIIAASKHQAAKGPT